MVSAAQNDAYGNAWGAPPPTGNSWQSQGQQQQGNQWGGPQWASGWGAPPFWHPAGVSKPAAIAFTVLGFIFWWPVGLAMLVYMMASGRFGCGRSRRWQGAGGNAYGPGNGWTPPWKNWCSGGNGGTPPSSGNRAFDEYRADTLRRLEEEQKEFDAFLDRLRVAKDKAEFDQFMAERRQRNTPTQPPNGDAPQA